MENQLRKQGNDPFYLYTFDYSTEMIIPVLAHVDVKMHLMSMFAIIVG